MAEAPPAILALYSDEDGKIRANANLPGPLIYCLTKLTNHAVYMEKSRAALEARYPGYDKDHRHEACGGKCGKWSWRDFGIPDGWNPTLELITPYCQFSRAEAMKGSNQVVAAVAGERAGQSLEGVGIAPDLTPRARPTDPPAPPMLNRAMQNGHGAIAEAKKEVSFGKRLIGLGRR